MENEAEKVIIRGEVNHKSAWGISSLYGCIIFFFLIMVAILLLVCIGGGHLFFSVGGLIFGIICCALMRSALCLSVTQFRVTDTSFWVTEAKFRRSDIVSINNTAFSGIEIKLKQYPYKRRIRCLKNRDEIIAILRGEPTPEPAPAPTPIQATTPDPEPMYEDCKVAVDEVPMYEDYKVAVEEMEPLAATKENTSQREKIEALLRAFSEIAQEQQKAVKPKRAISPQQRVGAQALVNTLSKIAKKRQKEEETTRKEIAKKRRQEKEDDLNALQTLFVKGHLTRKEYEEKKKRILRVTTTTYPLK
jgi:hypothetical protein